MFATIDIEARKITGISFQQTDEIDDPAVNLADELDEPTLIRLCEKFFELLDKDEDVWFKKLYSDSSMNREELIQSYYEYINQRLGGRPYFTDRRGHPNLVSYHAQIGITQQCMYKWLSLMEDAIDACDDIISRDIKSILMTFFTHLCSTYHVASNLMQQHENAPLYDDDFPVNCPIISTSNKQESIISSSDSVTRHKEYKK